MKAAKVVVYGFAAANAFCVGLNAVLFAQGHVLNGAVGLFNLAVAAYCYRTARSLA